MVDLAIGFDNGTLTAGEYLAFGSALVVSGMANSTGTFQRFVGVLVGKGLLTREGEITPAGYRAAREAEDGGV